MKWIKKMNYYDIIINVYINEKLMLIKNYYIFYYIIKLI